MVVDGQSWEESVSFASMKRKNCVNFWLEGVKECECLAFPYTSQSWTVVCVYHRGYDKRVPFEKKTVHKRPQQAWICCACDLRCTIGQKIPVRQLNYIYHIINHIIIHNHLSSYTVLPTHENGCGSGMALKVTLSINYRFLSLHPANSTIHDCNRAVVFVCFGRLQGVERHYLKEAFTMNLLRALSFL